MCVGVCGRSRGGALGWVRFGAVLALMPPDLCPKLRAQPQAGLKLGAPGSVTEEVKRGKDFRTGEAKHRILQHRRDSFIVSPSTVCTEKWEQKESSQG